MLTVLSSWSWTFMWRIELLLCKSLDAPIPSNHLLKGFVVG
jgi:hypothetical protein